MFLQQVFFKHLHYFRSFVHCAPSLTSSLWFLVYFSAILAILLLAFHLPVVSFTLPSVDFQDLALISWASFLTSVFRLLQSYCVSLLCFSTLSYYLSISFWLCNKKKCKSISCKPLFYFSNKKPNRELSHIVFVSHKTMKYTGKMRVCQIRGTYTSELQVLHWEIMGSRFVSTMRHTCLWSWPLLC